MENFINSFEELSKLPNDAPYYFNGSKTYTTGWKMHLFLNDGDNNFPSLHNSTMQKVSKFLIDKNLEHKFKNGNDGENTVCIYVGDRDDCEKLAKELTDKFGEEFSKLSKNGNDFKGSDQNLLNNPNVGIRFDGANEKLKDSPFSRYGGKGIPFFNMTASRNLYIANSILNMNISNEQEDKLKNIASHIILAKYCGDKYLGKNYHSKPWDTELFDSVSEFSAADINKYTQKCISMFKPEKYIKSTSLAENGEGYDIDVASKMKHTEKDKKQIILQFESGLDKKYEKWTREVISDFLNMFPEYKDRFSINDAKNMETKTFSEKEAKEAKAENPENAKYLEKQPDGRYLIKNSIDWHLQKGSMDNLLQEASSNGALDLRKADEFVKTFWPKNENGEIVVYPSSPIIISVFKQKSASTVVGMGNGYGVFLSAETSRQFANSPENEEFYFKAFLFHELGHTFKATHEEREGVEEHGGWHCTDPSCLMNKNAYQELNKNISGGKKRISYFCPKCMEAMKQIIPLITEGNTVNVSSEKIPERDDIAIAPFKTSLRLYWHEVAKKEGSKYKEENLRGVNYKATLTKTDGSATTIEAAGENNLSLSAKDAQGKAKIPDYKYFQDIAAYAKGKNSPVAFGSIKSPEFKARLLRACLEAEVKTVDAPKLDKPFMDSIKAGTKTELEKFKGKTVKMDMRRIVSEQEMRA